MGSLIVRPGCTFYQFHETHYNGGWNVYEGEFDLITIMYIQGSSRRRASKVSALHVARLGLNDGAQLWISQTFFENKHFFLPHIRDLHNKGLLCFEQSLKESCAPSFNPRRATFNALT